MTKPRLALAGCAAFLLCLIAPTSVLAGDLDQQQTTQDGFTSVATMQSLAQSVVAGRSGVLDQVDLFLSRTGSPPPLTVELRDFSAGFPGTQVLASASVPPGSVPTTAGFFPIPFSAPAPVSAGTEYAIVAYATSSPGNFYLWGDKGGNPYPNGTDFVSFATPPNTTWTDRTPLDTAFKTYVGPPPPASVTPTQTGQRAAALKKCKKKHSAKARKKCRKRAKKLPV